MMANKLAFDYRYRSWDSPVSGTPMGVASAPDQVNITQEDPTLFPPFALDIAHEGISSAEQRDEHQPSGLADQEANQAVSRSEVTGSLGEEIPELQPLDLAGQPTGQTGINLETDSSTVAIRVKYHSPIIVDDMTIYISYMHGFCTYSSMIGLTLDLLFGVIFGRKK
jgi:hypothetical protein